MAVDVSIVTSGHDVADARLHRLTAALQRRGLTVEVLGLGNATDGPAGATTHTWKRQVPPLRAVHALTLPWRARGRTLVALDPDSTFGTWVRARLTHRAVVADVHEDYAAVLHDRTWARGVRRYLGTVWAYAGLFASKHANLLVVADDHLVPDFPRRLVVQNLPDLTGLPTPEPPGRQARAIYVGDVRRSRGLYRMLDVMRHAPDWHLDIVGPVAREDQQATALEPDLAQRVRFHGRLPPHEAWGLARGAWAGLALLEDTPAFSAALPTKVYEYLACGLPVLSSPLPRPAALIEQTGAGAVVDDAVHGAAMLQAWSEDPASHARARAAALRWRQDLADDAYARFANAVADAAPHPRDTTP